MKTFRYISIILSSFLICSCIALDKSSSIEVSEAREPVTKVARLSDDYDTESFLLKFDIVPSDALLAELTADKGIRLEKLFISTPGKEQLESRFGLDRWYVSDVPEGISLDDLIAEVASLSEVALVQYNHKVRKASDCIVYSYDGPEQLTKANATSFPFNDPSIVDQWHYWNQGNASIATSVKKGADINVVDTWTELICGDPSIIVAVVDEGVKYTHPDLKDNMWVNSDEIPGNGVDDDGNGYIDDVYGYNFVDEGQITWAEEGDTGHGTHCAGTIAAVNNNGKGVAGVAGGSGKGDGCRIMSCQIFSGSKGGAVGQTVNAIKYAADNGASVISCSFGYTTAFKSDNDYIKRIGSAEIDAIHYFEASKNNDVLDGNIAIFAAGNDAHDYAHYPGAYHDIISVSAFGPDYLPTRYTNYGPGCNIAAPGGDAGLPPWTSYKALVLSTVPSEIEQVGVTKPSTGLDYGYMQGTSMACPHVSGVVALALAYSKKLGKTFAREEFKNMIVTSANDLDQRLKGNKTYKDGTILDISKFYHKMGTGSIDTWLLMMKIEGTQCLTAEIGKKQWIDLSNHFGTASTSLTYLDLEYSDSTKESLGLVEDPYIEYGRLYIHPTKMGAGKFKITAVGGGDQVGGGDNVGGMEVSQEVSIVTRSIKADNGGWL